MFNIGPMELIVLGLVGLIVLGPDRLPGLARDAARMIRTLRDMATGAQTQLRDELGPEFADVDLRNLNPRTALQKAILGDDVDMRKLNPRTAFQDMVLGTDQPSTAPSAASAGTPAADVPVEVPISMQKPLGRGEQAPYDADAT